jgi:uncharacterized protein YwgA
VSFDILRKEKGAEILVALLKGAMGEREIQDVVEGSYTTIIDRIKELLAVDLVEEVELTGDEYGKAPHNKRLFRLTEKGRALASSLVGSHFLEIPVLNKARQRWAFSTLAILGTVKGRTRFMKLLFLLRYELGVKTGNFPKFRAWIYGPFSRELAEDLEELRDSAFIIETPVPIRTGEFQEEESSSEYRLSSKGEKLASDIMNGLTKSELEKLNRLVPFNRMPLKDLLKYVYRRYPKFISRSEIVGRVLDQDRT